MPQPNPNVLKALEDVLQAEMAAINSYFIHAEQLIDRIVYFDAIPNLNKIGRIKVGKTVREQFELALDLETLQVGRINNAIVACNEANDDGTRLVLEPTVTAGESSIDWLKTQITALDALGDSAYLAQQLDSPRAPARCPRPRSPELSGAGA